ncbi:MAG TPA: hypothetical protein VKE25_00245 [Actinomycetes bacterium]|nr:hypothetical protein [Actinomycetes bacterium]
MSRAIPGDRVGWPPDNPVEQWIVVDVTGHDDMPGDEIAVCRHESDLEERNLAAAPIDTLVVVGQPE